MAFDAREVANEFLKLAWAEGKDITPMQLVKLTYIAHGWNLALNDGPLIVDKVYAWKYGPVVRPVYTQFKDFGREAITELAYNDTYDGRVVPYELWDPFDEEETASAQRLVKRVWKGYGGMNGIQLSAITHQPGTPWATVTKNGTDVGESRVIPNDLIAKHYKKLRDERNVRA